MITSEIAWLVLLNVFLISLFIRSFCMCFCLARIAKYGEDEASRAISEASSEEKGGDLQVSEQEGGSQEAGSSWPDDGF